MEEKTNKKTMCFCSLVERKIILIDVYILFNVHWPCERLYFVGSAVFLSLKKLQVELNGHFERRLSCALVNSGISLGNLYLDSSVPEMPTVSTTELKEQ